MKTIKLSLFILLLSAAQAFPQQDTPFSMNIFNKVYYNPAYAGVDGNHTLSALQRKQWIDFDGSSNASFLSYEGNFDKYNSGIGISFSNDAFGPMEDNHIGFCYNYRFDFYKKSSLRLGTRLSYIKTRIDIPGYVISQAPFSYQPPYKYINNSFPDLDLGIWYDLNGKYYAGVSLRHVYPLKFTFEGRELDLITRHYYIITGYNWQIPNSPFRIIPSVLFLKVGPTNQMKINIIAHYKEKCMAGASYRIDNNISMYAGIRINKEFFVLVSYSPYFGRLSSYSKGTMEFGFKYNFSSGKDD